MNVSKYPDLTAALLKMNREVSCSATIRTNFTDCDDGFSLQGALAQLQIQQSK